MTALIVKLFAYDLPSWDASLHSGLAMPTDGETVAEDLLRGEIVIANAQVDDQVLLKSDGNPTYHLANVVDDHLMVRDGLQVFLSVYDNLEIVPLHTGNGHPLPYELLRDALGAETVVVTEVLPGGNLVVQGLGEAPDPIVSVIVLEM